MTWRWLSPVETNFLQSDLAVVEPPAPTFSVGETIFLQNDLAVDEPPAPTFSVGETTYVHFTVKSCRGKRV